jgi:hemolysin III
VPSSEAALDSAAALQLELPFYEEKEEVANVLTHGLGALLSVAALVLMVVFSALNGDAWHITSCAVFGTSLVVLYLASTLYHGARQPAVKRFMRWFDHGAIFLLIAGTYTPFTLVSLRGPLGWWLFGTIWFLAFLGVFFQTSLLQRWEVLRVGLYIAMGWAAVVAYEPLAASLDLGGVVLLVGGGLAYTLGVIFYAWEALPFSHAIWHVFVLMGSGMHFLSVFFYVIPSASMAS